MSVPTVLFRLALLVAGLATVSCGDGVPTAPDSLASSTSSSTSSSSGSTSGTGSGTVTTPGTGSGSGTTATVSYVQDIKPILDSDCIVCHGASRPEKGVSLNTYANVMRQVVAGSTASRLIRETASNGSMYRYFTGSKTNKSALIRSWIVDNNAVETR
ncbi:MAG: hypothetical protein AB7I50_05785 [Vicinamibacterales bacterium]